jgi:ubiquinone/menaquinone biosynthesis C-methylase UbiE
VLILEFSRPQSAIGRRLANFYFQHLVPWLSWLGARDREARLLMQYCADTVDRCVQPAVIVAAMQSAGFTEIKHRRFGLVCEYSARRP